jgi:hypothetical protein
MFTPAKLHTDSHNFITFDIESMFVPYKTDDENKRYVRIHKPWLICYQMIDFIDGKYVVNDAETFMYNNDLNGVSRKGNFIIGTDCCERFIGLLMQPTICAHYKYIYAHNGAKYDNVLMLDSIIKMVNMRISPLFNSGRLLSLKITAEKGVIEFRDSNLLLSMPLKSFNKELGLGL